MISENNLLNLFDHSVRQFGTKNCIVSVTNIGIITLTYDDMNRQMKKLNDSYIFPKYSFIGILGHELTPEIIVCILGILKSDAAFVFLNPAESEMVSMSIQTLRIKYLIGATYLVQTYLSEHDDMAFNFIKAIAILEKEFAVWHREFDEETISARFSFAFAVFSSRSTKSISKIIKVPHQSILPNILDLKGIYQLQSTDTLYISTPVTFDPCIHDIFLAFSSGCCILLAHSVLKYQPQFIRRLFSPEGFNVSVFFTTPSVFQKWFPQIWPCSLRILILGGEPFPPIRLFADAFTSGVQIYSVYGITEVSCWASVSRMRSIKAEMSLGSVLSDTIFEVRDEVGDTIEDGIGELFIGSINRVCVVDDDFEFAKIRPCFRASGDLVKVSNKEYFFLGRKDRRIKLYGHQIDFSLIEENIKCHLFIKTCHVFIDNDQIIALVEVTSTSDIDVTTDILKKSASRDLPTYMLPRDIYIVPELPLNSHGKVSPRDCEILYQQLKCLKATEEEFRNLWLKYTTQSSINTKSGFLESGGNSFTALLLTTGLECVTEIPRNLMEFLITNKSFSDCIELINSSISNENRPSNFSATEKRNLESEITFSRIKKMKLCHNLIRALHKGHSLPFLIDFPAISQIDIQWRSDLEKCVDSSPTLLVFENQTIVVCGSHSGSFIIVELETGNVISKMKLPDRIESSACASSDGSHIFIGCYDGKMYAIDFASSSVTWIFQTNDIIKSTAVLHDQKLFFGSYDHNFYCISCEDGSLCWKVNIDNSAICTTAIVRSDIIIIATLGGTVAFVDHEGIIKSKTDNMKPIFCNPAEISEQEIFVVIDVTGSIRCFDLNTFSELWRCSINECVFSSISIMRNKFVKIVFGCQSGNIFCFQVSRMGERKVWQYKMRGEAYSTPFCYGNFQSIIAASTDGSVYILDAVSGEPRTTYSIKAPVFSSPVAYGTWIVIGSRDNYLYCLKVL